MINPFVATAVLVMLPVVEGDPGCPSAAPLPPAGIVTIVALDDSAEPASDPVGDLLREIGKKKLREEMNKALYEAKQLGRTPEEIFLYRSQNPDAEFKPQQPQPQSAAPPARPAPDGNARRKDR